MRQGERGLQILEFIETHSSAKGYAPTIREIGDAVGLKSPATVHGHLERLKRNGCLTYVASKPRTVRVVE